MVAQMAFESGYGKSDLAKIYNNFGGIKCAPQLYGVVGCTGLLPTLEPDKTGKLAWTKASFSIFKDQLIGINGHTKVLMKDRYTNARLNAKSAYDQLYMIAQAGYGGRTAKEYADAMKSIVEAAQDITGLGRIS
jgi:flagellum-specific peptidoglycan hydrolase FlgJ